METEGQRQSFTNLLQTQAEEIDRINTQKQQLILIIIENTDARSRLEKLTRFILESKVQGSGAKTPDQDHIMSSLFSQISYLSTSQLTSLNKTLESAFEPHRIYQKLTDEIGEVLRSDLTDEDKIRKISTVLI